MGYRRDTFQDSIFDEIVNADYDKNIGQLLRKRATRKNNRSADPIYSQLFIICQENDYRKLKTKSTVQPNTKNDHSKTKLTQRVKPLQPQTHKRSFTTSYSVQLPPIEKKFDPLPSSDLKKNTLKGTHFSMAIQSQLPPRKLNKSVLTQHKKGNHQGHPRIKNTQRYSTLNSESRPGKIEHLKFLGRQKKLVEQNKSEPEKQEREWKEVQILRLETYFIKLKRNKKSTTFSESKVGTIRQSSIMNIVPDQARIPDFIKAYKVTNQEIDVDSLVKMERFGIIFEEGYSLYFGELQKGIRDGVGIYVCSNYKYEGLFRMDQKVEGCEITLNGHYKGKFQGNKRSGLGEYVWRNGQSYSGEWKDGQKSGSGIWKSGKGDSYIGQWVSGKVEGYGVHTSATGQRYEGEFKEFLKSGKGVETFPNGDVYKGEYLNGNAHGHGKYTWKNKITFEGNFENGYRQGKGKLVAKNCLRFSGNFKYDLPHGEGCLILENGDTYIGRFEKGYKNGEGTLRMKSQQKILSGKWKDNKFLFAQ